MSVQIAGLRQQVDPHWQRGISYLKIGLRSLQGVVYKGRQLLSSIALLPQDPQPCFASNRAEQDFYDQIVVYANSFLNLQVLICLRLTEMCQAGR